ncbi:MAG: DUF5906 domain-containing protein [Porphyromonadaceae bacterium]|nr:DUF5906 domain-containing protein [Porphyromonadaceae bacterium]
MTHEPQEGSWTTIDSLFHHIFGEQYDMGLDYVQLLYQKPTQTLPILCLLSKENQTGKSTFFQFLNYVFGNNISMVRPEDIDNQFNSYVAGKLLVYLEESNTADNAKLTEKVKALSTAPKIPMTMKGSETVEVSNFTKFALTSNHPTRFMYVGQNEERFWLRIVPKLSEEKKRDVDFKMRLIEEIPAFLYYLNNRKIATPCEDRNWFAPWRLETEAMRAARDEQKPHLQKKIEEYLRELFLAVGERELYYTPEQLRDYTKGIFDREDSIKLKNYLQNVIGLKQFVTEADEERGLTSSNKKYTIFTLYDEEIDGVVYSRIKQKKTQGRCFVFPVEKFLTQEEIRATFSQETQTEISKPKDTQTEIPY